MPREVVHIGELFTTEEESLSVVLLATGMTQNEIPSTGARAHRENIKETVLSGNVTTGSKPP